MRILVLLEPVTFGAGAYNHWMELSKRLEVRGHIVKLSCHVNESESQSPSLKLRPAELYKFGKRLRSMVNDFQPDLIISSISQSDIAFWLLRPLLGMSNLKWVVVALGVPFPIKGLKVPSLKRILWKKLWVASANSADVVGAIGSNLSLKLEMEGLGNRPTTLKPLIDFSSFETKTKNEKSKSIFFVGRLSEEKNPDFFCRLQSVFPNTKFNLVGNGPEAPELKRKYPNLNFLGHLPQGQFWGEIDMLFLTSRTEGIPLTLLEASMRRIPFLSTSVGSVVDLVHPENRALLLLEGEEMYDMRSWATRFQKLESDLLWPELIQKQFDHVSSLFNPEILLDQFLSFIEKKESR